MRPLILPLMCLPLLACEPLSQVGRAPDFTAPEDGFEHAALYRVPLPDESVVDTPKDRASLWSAGERSLLGDRRASSPGDILTVVIEIDDSAQMSNTTARGRSGSNSMAGPSLFGIPEAIDRNLPGGLSLAAGIETQGGTEFSGSGSVSRNEQLTLRVASTVVERLPNDILRIEGRQEVRVNHELRELLVTGYVRPADISRQNEIGYDKIANARISYGGRGILSGVQQPRYGSQILEIITPF
ncbi:MAG: flagellar L-ring protein precursor FlgH [Roseibaca calidilacus]|uniref:Flagellar L-ring protein n=1 Tax=Roseibaca calidilacus TaxID=1666912 RepID=A0A0P7X5L9_9RHOB|nr:flagellar basal body L-ring protein FlgH [Roseibaca calidilacus]KPP95846.1 MAG: flagellar L-ring protein precursor FlgH [Roseibaca calidilacus]CUX81612.1 flagellar L-ring protein precursor FlgH [Roseibaca calidilacus]